MFLFCGWKNISFIEVMDGLIGKKKELSSMQHIEMKASSDLI